jgi:hypothetical protein
MLFVLLAGFLVDARVGETGPDGQARSILSPSPAGMMVLVVISASVGTGLVLLGCPRQAARLLDDAVVDEQITGR